MRMLLPICLKVAEVSLQIYWVLMFEGIQNLIYITITNENHLHLSILAYTIENNSYLDNMANL